ncbi:hypothetical protein ACH5RR_037510 [Cinchona calisaya]|uniref:Uncharacterized protein n=1 Tax=Cinchona calisaya TaxID=153742 RepID=A0ABD2Y6F0_9GENT
MGKRVMSLGYVGYVSNKSVLHEETFKLQHQLLTNHNGCSNSEVLRRDVQLWSCKMDFSYKLACLGVICWLATFVNSEMFWEGRYRFSVLGNRSGFTSAPACLLSDVGFGLG